MDDEASHVATKPMTSQHAEATEGIETMPKHIEQRVLGNWYVFFI
jgi:hypothetical protein